MSVQRGEAHAAGGAVSIVTDDWTYSVPLDGVRWVDPENTWHESGRPSCLAPAATPVQVTFGAVQVTLEGVTWRSVVWVSCR